MAVRTKSKSVSIQLLEDRIAELEEELEQEKSNSQYYQNFAKQISNISAELELEDDNVDEDSDDEGEEDEDDDEE